MNLPFAILAILLASLNLSLAGPAFDRKSIPEIKIRNANFDLVNTIKDKSEISEIIDCLSRASKIGDTSSITRKHTHKIDAKDRWLYDDASGDFTVLSKSVTPVFQVTEKDKLRIRSFLKTNSAEQDAAANP
jgi:hypothetical protein